MCIHIQLQNQRNNDYGEKHVDTAQDNQEHLVLQNADEKRQGSVYDFLFGGEVDPEKILSHAAARKEFFRPSRGAGGMLPQKILKI